MGRNACQRKKEGCQEDRNRCDISSIRLWGCARLICEQFSLTSCLHFHGPEGGAGSGCLAWPPGPEKHQGTLYLQPASKHTEGWIGLTPVQLTQSTADQWIVRSNWVDFVICKLYFNKVVKKVKHGYWKNYKYMYVSILQIHIYISIINTCTHAPMHIHTYTYVHL